MIENPLRKISAAAMLAGAVMACSALTFGQAANAGKAPVVRHAALSRSAPNRERVVDTVIQRNLDSWKEQGRGVPEDWTHHHVVFSDPGTEAEADAREEHDRWHRIAENPRFTMQQLTRGAGVKSFDNGWGVLELGRGRPAVASLPPSLRPKAKISKTEKDWAEGLGAGLINPNTSPAKWSFSTSTASCANDFVIYPTGLPDSGSAAEIIAYYNVYSGCSAPSPKVDWAYKTGGTISGSPVFSFTGSQIAFIQVNGSTASLTLLRLPATPGTGTLASPTTVANQASASAYYNGGTGCTAPCRWSVALNGSPNDSWSSPFYDYSADTLYVGDSAGKLHRFSPVFNGVLTETTTSWPVDLSASDNTQTSSPVYDATSGKVFVGTFGGRVYSVGTGNAGTTSGTVYGTSAQLDGTNGIRDGVLLDSSAGRFYVFVGQDTGTGNASGVYQFSTAFTAASIKETRVNSAGGTGVTALQMSGAFDNTYFTSANAASPSGNLYMCDTGLQGKLYQIPIASNIMGSSTAKATLTDSSLDARCSPITEFFNGSVGGTAATGTIVIQTDPGFFGGWPTTETVTVGAVTYTLSTSAPGANANHVLRDNNVFTSAANREARTAQNLRAAIDGVSAECFDSNCFGTGTVDNPAVTTSISTNTISLTATTVGPAGFALTTSYATGIVVDGGDNGTSGTDLIFFSVMGSPLTGCTDPGNSGVDGCIVSFDVTNSAAVAQSGIGLNIIAGTSSSRTTPTGAMVIDNSVGAGTLAGASQIYFLTTYAANGSCSTAGTGICATQASQTSP